MYDLLLENPKQTKEDIAEKAGISRATVTRSLQRLVESGKIRRTGSNKTWYWEIL
ncbi:winged helix-turn-helix transcriptional regulator [Treponema sp.]|uniref:winged helix-turn-helix transcriptional regulator n=1 Tax=Treponema sp. TaxID=166 RepID=UPI00388DA895